MKKKNLGHPSYLSVSCTGYHILADAWDQTKHNKHPLPPIQRTKCHYIYILLERFENVTWKRSVACLISAGAALTSRSG